MKILVFGAGAIGSLLIHYLCEAKNDVTVIARSICIISPRSCLIAT